MEASLQIDARQPDKLLRVLEPSLDDQADNSFRLEAREEQIGIKIETESLGPLRGCTDTAFRLTMLSKKILER